MQSDKRGMTIASSVLVAAGVLFLGLSIFFNGLIDFTLPLIFLTIGPGFVLLVFALAARWRYAPLFYLPAGVFIAFGLVFLLNVVTNDWQAWSYAWLLPVAGLGVGGVLAARHTPLPASLLLVSLVVAALGFSLFGVFGAIVGGMFIRVAAPLLLVAGGLGLRFGWFRDLLPAASAWPLGGRSSLAETAQAPGAKPDALVEPLSARELEVLAMIGQGLSNAEIAGRLSLAASTVKTHINNIYGKLGVQTRVQAVNKARALKLII
jgi:DNA-binding CsgD family transcriptional regulator